MTDTAAEVEKAGSAIVKDEDFDDDDDKKSDSKLGKEKK